MNDWPLYELLAGTARDALGLCSKRLPEQRVGQNQRLAAAHLFAGLKFQSRSIRWQAIELINQLFERSQIQDFAGLARNPHTQFLRGEGTLLCAQRFQLTFDDEHGVCKC